MAGGTEIATVNVGATRTGKSTLTRELLKAISPKYTRIIQDPNAEYTDLYDEPFLDYDEFIEEKVLNAKNSVIVFEEASIFFDAKRKDRRLVSKLVRKRHEHNIFILNFHSFKALPAYILDYIDYINIKQTNDTLRTFKDKLDQERHIKAFEAVNDSHDPFITKTIAMKSLSRKTK